MKLRRLLLSMLLLTSMFVAYGQQKHCVSDAASYIHCQDTIHVNGTSLVYEMKGHGAPILLLHGNGGSHHDLDSVMNVLANAGYLVYGIDSRGQGANPPVSEYHYTDMAEDIYQFIKALNLQAPALYGWSDGGNIALQLEVLHPGTCALIITSGANLFPDGWGGHQKMVERIKKDPNPKPLRKMLYYEPNMTFEDMSRIACPTLICVGQHDIVLRSHTQGIVSHLPNGELHVEAKANHTSYVKHSTRIAQIILDFLHKVGY